jgi:hypothetical protein
MKERTGSNENFSQVRVNALKERKCQQKTSDAGGGAFGSKKDLFKNALTAN